MDIQDNIVRFWNNRELFMNMYDIDNDIINKYNIIEKSLPYMEYLPTHIQGRLTLFPISKYISVSYCLSKKLLMIIPQACPEKYVYYTGIDEYSFKLFIYKINSLRL